MCVTVYWCMSEGVKNKLMITLSFYKTTIHEKYLTMNLTFLESKTALIFI